MSEAATPPLLIVDDNEGEDPRLRRHVPVIMISALDEMESVVRCIELGAEDYLPKPLAIHGTLRPAYEVVGDLYDCFWIQPGRFARRIADVSDKGAAAALFMARSKTALRLLAMRMARGADAPVPAADLVCAANEELCRDNRLSMFVTLFLAIGDTATGAVEWCNAGHPLPYRIGRDGSVGSLPYNRSIPLGLRPAMLLASGTFDLADGDSLFAFTDGITEATNDAGEFFGEERLKAALTVAARESPETMIDAVLFG